MRIGSGVQSAPEVFGKRQTIAKHLLSEMRNFLRHR